MFFKYDTNLYFSFVSPSILMYKTQFIAFVSILFRAIYLSICVYYILNYLCNIIILIEYIL